MALSEAGERALALPADMTDPDAVGGAFAVAVERFDLLDALFCGSAWNVEPLSGWIGVQS